VLGEVGHDGKVLAGGQSLVPMLNMRLAAPGHLVDINRVAGLDRIDVMEREIRVGALVRHAALERDEQTYGAHPLLRQALRHVAHPAIRNRGTTVGSIAHADAAGEMPAVLVLTEGVVEVAGPSGSREVAAADFFLGPLETTLEDDELAVAVRFGRFPAGTVTAFTESARRHGDYALAGVAAAVTVVDGLIKRVRVGLVSVTDVPVAVDVTDAVGRVEPDLGDWGAAAEAVRAVADPESDIHASADYRRMLVGELTVRALAQAVGTSRAATPEPAAMEGSRA
jgi:carbon-monoxide dehydrogenase medium subunit